MTRRQKWHVLTISGLLMTFILFTNFYLHHVISEEPQNSKKPSTQAHHQMTSNKALPNSNINRHFYSIFHEWKKELSLHGKVNLSTLWKSSKKWSLEDGSIYNPKDPHLSHVLEALRNARVLHADNSNKGTQLKLSLILEGNQKVLFKPRWYSRGQIIKGSVYSGKDRHTAEVVAFYLSLILDLNWVPLAVMRKINMKKEVWDVATPQLKQTIFPLDNGSLCLYGKCFYCRRNESVCNDSQGELEGAIILMVDQTFKKYRSPWQRTYNVNKHAEWERNDNYCGTLKKTLPLTRILDLVDAAIFDFLLQNGDRHHYETFMDRVVLLDNGKGLGNPHKDYTDILAPLYQCCVIRKPLWERLRLLSGGALSLALSELTLQESTESIITEDHLLAMDRRLLTVFSVVDVCLSKYGKSIFKNN